MSARQLIDAQASRAVGVSAQSTDSAAARRTKRPPAVSDKRPFQSWGPGKFDPRFQAFNGRSIVRLNSTTLPVVIPSIFGLQGIGFETVTGDGPISYWNNYVGVTQMGGQGSFRIPGLGLTSRNPRIW